MRDKLAVSPASISGDHAAGLIARVGIGTDAKLNMSALPIHLTAASVAIDAQNALIDKGYDVEFSRDGASGALILTLGARSASIRMIKGGRIHVSIGPDDLAPLDPVALLTWWLTPSRGS